MSEQTRLNPWRKMTADHAEYLAKEAETAEWRVRCSRCKRWNTCIGSNFGKCVECKEELLGSASL